MSMKISALTAMLLVLMVPSSSGADKKKHGAERGMDPLPALPDRLVRQPDDEEFGQAGGNLHLHLDGARLEPEKCDRGDLRDHPLPLLHLSFSIHFGGKHIHFE